MDNIGRNLLLSAGISLGVAISGASLYLLFRDNDEKVWKMRDNKQKIKQCTQSMVTIRVPKPFVGAVIGHGGERIKQIQTDTNTRINFDDSNVVNGEDNGHKDLRILMIRGTPDNTARAELAINEIIKQQSMIVTKKFMVDTTSVGFIIGRNGDTIRSLCDRSDAKIKVDRKGERNAIQTSIWITGTEEQISEAELLINELIAENTSRNRPQNYRQKSLNYHKLNAIEEMSKEDKNSYYDNYFAKLEPINGNQMIEVFVSSVINPEHFYVQIAGVGAEQLDHLMEESTDFYEVPDNRLSFKLMKRLKVGDFVAVPYERDEHWYRARVMSVEDQPYCLEESNVKVFYLDYGDEAVFKYKQICDLKDNLLRRLPFQAIQCSLAGLKAKHNVWSEDAIKQFQELSHNALWKKLYARVVDIGIDDKKEKYFIELFDKNVFNVDVDDNDWNDEPKPTPNSGTNDSLNIGEELIRRDFAVPYVESND